jgi:phage shock protein PspC (stress-responsive transcriptional regulator)
MPEKRMYRIVKKEELFKGGFQVGGVCDGLGEYFNLDSVFFRIE